MVASVKAPVKVSHGTPSAIGHPGDLRSPLVQLTSNGFVKSSRPSPNPKEAPTTGIAYSRVNGLGFTVVAMRSRPPPETLGPIGGRLGSEILAIVSLAFQWMVDVSPVCVAIPVLPIWMRPTISRP